MISGEDKKYAFKNGETWDVIILLLNMVEQAYSFTF